jgi:protein gp37
MADNGKLSSSDFKWIILLGCTIVSEGCQNCWALFEAYRQACTGSKLYKSLVKVTSKGLAWSGEVVFLEHRLNEPQKYVGANIWVAPHSDLFHPKVSLDVIAKIYAVIATTPQNNFQILTKRIERMHKVYTDGSLRAAVEKILGHVIEWPLKNIWEGTSVENEKVAKTRLPLLKSLPSNYKYVSYQPLLGEVDAKKHMAGEMEGKFVLAILGGEAGANARPFNRTALAKVRNQLNELEIPNTTQCYPL